MFEEYNRDLLIYRQTEAVGFADVTWEYVATVRGRIEPVSAGESYVNNQNNQTASHVAFLSSEYKNVIKPQDGIIDEFGTEYINISTPEDWPDLIPYIMPKLEQKQFRVTP